MVTGRDEEGLHRMCILAYSKSSAIHKLYTCLKHLNLK
jgi:hypothetical protein